MLSGRGDYIDRLLPCVGPLGELPEKVHARYGTVGTYNKYNMTLCAVWTIRLSTVHYAQCVQ